jgi:hypothetical protein
MASSKTNKARAEVEKARLKLAEQQSRFKELEAKQTECENLEIVDIVRGMSIPLDNLAAVLQSLKGSETKAAPTSGQLDPKLAAPKIIKAEPGEEDENE